MSQHPALLQTDIVDSTRLSQQLGDSAMAALWEAHDRVARDLLRQWRGREIDKSDGFLLLFTDAADAVAFALAYHHAIAALRVPLQARAGLHVGPLITRENSPADVAWGAKPLEVEGLAKPTTSRVMSLALGGQTLLTAEARHAIGRGAWSLQSHGHWRLQGLEDPIELFELHNDKTPSRPPPDNAKGWRVLRQNDLWVPMRELRHSLPAELDGFIGRQHAMRELTQRFETGARLVSLLGIAGTGKSRLAQRFGWTWLGDYPGGVWFCDLSQARTLDGIFHAVAQGLDVPLGAADPAAQLGSAIVGRGVCLVILDNFEQVARHAEATIGRWLNRTTEARFIVTTREVLSIAGEQVMALAPLDAAESEALFLRRASAARPDFRLTAEDTLAVVSLVQLLDGLPLAIELAAARVRVMPPRTLLTRMSERFKVLASTGGRSDRQATLRNAFDWSWDLMSQAERSALAQFSVFEGGFTLTAAEAVLDLSACPDAPWPIDVLQSLLGKSFVRQVNEQRFDLLSSVQEYAAEHLRTEGRFPASGPIAKAAADARHGSHYAGLDERAAIASRCVETDNLVIACRRAADQGQARIAVGALAGAWAALALRGPFRGALALVELVRAMPGLGDAERATVEWVAGSAHQLLGESAIALQAVHAGLDFARLGSSPDREACLLRTLGDLQASRGEAEQARANLNEALAQARRLGNKPFQINVMNSLGTLLDQTGRIDDAFAVYTQALALARELRDRRWEGGVLGNLGMVHLGRGEMDEARLHFDQALAVARECGDRRWEGNTLCNLGLVHLDQGRNDDARVHLTEALRLSRELGHVRLESIVLCNLGLVESAEDQLDEALGWHAEALAIVTTTSDRRTEAEIHGYMGWLLAKLSRHNEARASFAAGTMALGDDSALPTRALLLCRRGQAEHMAGNDAAARSTLLEVQELAASSALPAGSELARCLDELQQLVDHAAQSGRNALHEKQVLNPGCESPDQSHN